MRPAPCPDPCLRDRVRLSKVRYTGSARVTESGVWMKRVLLIVFVVLMAAAPAAAQERMGFESWGVRLGVASDPDQVVGGVQWNLGELARDLRLVPNFEVGLGDDATLIMASAPVHYVFRNADAAVTPYLGAGLTLGWIDLDRKRGDSSDFEIALEGIGGVEWNLSESRRFFVELNLVFGDFHDAQVLAGWSF